MKNCLFCLLLLGISLSISSCSRESKEVLYKIPAGTNVKECSIVFSNYAPHLAYVEEKTEGEAVVYDEKSDKTYPAIDVLSLSSDGNHFAYIALLGKKEIVVKDGNTIATYPYKTIIREDDTPKSLQFLNDGSLIYTTRVTEKMNKIMKDAKPIDKSPYSAKPKVSIDGNHLLYWVVDGTGDFLVFDGKRQRISNMPLFTSISGDGEHYGAVTRNGNKMKVIIDGNETTTIESKNAITYFVLSHKGKHFIALQDDPSANQIKIKYDGEVVSVALKVFTNSIAFSNDDLHYAFTIMKANVKKAIIVLDGKEIQSYDPNFSRINDCFNQGRKLVFSPDGEHILYVAGTGTNQILALDQKIIMRLNLYNAEILKTFFSSAKDVNCMFLDKIKKQIVKSTKTVR